MSGSADFAQFVETKFSAKLKADYPTTKFYTPNALFAPPKGAPYFGYTVTEGSTVDLSIGATKSQRTVFVMKIFLICPVETNDRRYIQEVEDVASIFQGQSFAISLQHSVIFRRATVNSGPEAKEGKYHVVGTITGHRDLNL